MSEITLEDLKNCPFCGHTVQTGIMNVRSQPYRIYCPNCHTYSPDFYDLKELAAWWNTRPIEYGLQAENICLKTEIDISTELERNTYPIEDKLRAENENLSDTIGAIKNWCNAYPLEVFPEPDMKQVRKVLEAGGLTIDCVSASCMRRVLDGVKRIIKLSEVEG